MKTPITLVTSVRHPSARCICAASTVQISVTFMSNCQKYQNLVNIGKEYRTLHSNT
jgi:hypothetical protein